VDTRDPLSLLGLVTMGARMDGGALVVPDKAAAAIRWRLAHHRSTGINPEVAIRSCSVDVAFGDASETFGSFRIGYTVAVAGDGAVQVQLTD
jgi:hypothetical protein